MIANASSRRWRRAVALTFALLSGLAAFVSARGTDPATAAPGDLSFLGHGFGHGRGLGQYGAYGYAKQGWTASRILDHFYGGTTMGSVGNDVIPVGLSGVTASITADDGGITASGQAGPSGSWKAERNSNGTIALFRGSRRCAGWTKVADVASPVTFSPSTDTTTGAANTSASLTMCDTSKRYRGQVQALVEGSAMTVLNLVPLEAYLRGVVAAEMPASWSAAALQAQSVAARSYTMASDRSGAQKICDTTACQVYTGIGAENANTDAAIAATAGQVRRMSSGAVALTEFSSSTGGWSAGGTFPAVRDDGDAMSGNPYHSYTSTLSPSSIASKYNVGTYRSFRITVRNGLGAEGGRVRELIVTGSVSSKTVSGSQFRADFPYSSGTGIRTDWFTASGPGVETPPATDINGYWTAGADGAVFAFGAAPDRGGQSGVRLNKPIVGMAATPSSGGYWLVASDGGIFSHGDATFHGSAGNIRLNKPIVGMTATPSGRGYWMVASDGGIFTYGDAPFHGSAGNIRLNKPIVGMTATPTGRGYWMVASDGGIFTYGDAAFHGSAGNLRLNKPIVGMATTPTGRGYWMVASDGGIFTYGDATFFGTPSDRGITTSTIGIIATRSGRGYILGTVDGQFAGFGDAGHFGNLRDKTTTYTGTLVSIAGAVA